MTNTKNILVFLPNWVGDVVMATPALRALRGAYPKARIAYLGRPVAIETVRGTPWADELIVDESSKKGLCEFAKLAMHLRGMHFDLAVLLPNSFRTALLARVGAGVGEVIGYDRDGRGMLLTRKLAPQRDEEGQFTPVPTIDYYNAIVRELGGQDLNWQMQLHVQEQDQRQADSLLREAGWTTDFRDSVQSPRTARVGQDQHPLVMLNPGASFGPSKLWPADRFAAVADELIARRGAAIIINAAPAEKEIAQAVESAMKHKPLINFAGRPNSLGLLKGLLGRCDLLITNDTGARHIAAACGAGLVTIFGSTDPTWARIDYPRERTIRVDVPCSPCQQKECTQPPGATYHQCMAAIGPEMVLSAALEVLDSSPAPQRGTL